jgi:hypothetical protein
MKKLLLFSAMAFTTVMANAQDDKSKLPSPPAKVSETINGGTTVTIDYSQPGVKGRTIGKDIAPYGKVWRTGANAATVFEISKDVKVEGQNLPAGKYSLYSIPGENEWVLIFNKSWNQPGTRYNQEQDALRVTVKPGKSKDFSERMTFVIHKRGAVSLLWGNEKVDFSVK